MRGGQLVSGWRSWLTYRTKLSHPPAQLWLYPLWVCTLNRDLRGEIIASLVGQPHAVAFEPKVTDLRIESRHLLLKKTDLAAKNVSHVGWSGNRLTQRRK